MSTIEIQNNENYPMLLVTPLDPITAMKIWGCLNLAEKLAEITPTQNNQETAE